MSEQDRVYARLARAGNFGLEVQKRYDDKGVRLTDCCGSSSTHGEDGVQHCMECFSEVLAGEGDGTETKN